MDVDRYKVFVDLMVNKYGTRWAAIILGDGDIPAYRAYDENHTDRFLRSTRSFYWTMMSMGDMAGMPDLEGKYLEVIWNEKYLYDYHLYMFRLEKEIVMIATNKKIEEFIIELVSNMEEENAPKVPGLVGFGIGDYKGNPKSTYIDMNIIRDIGGKKYEEEEVKRILEEATKLTFERFLYMGEAGFGDGKYMEINWENISGYMFPYKDMVAVAMFTTGKIDTMRNILSYLLKKVEDGE